MKSETKEFDQEKIKISTQTKEFYYVITEKWLGFGSCSTASLVSQFLHLQIPSNPIKTPTLVHLHIYIHTHFKKMKEKEKATNLFTHMLGNPLVRSEATIRRWTHGIIGRGRGQWFPFKILLRSPLMALSFTCFRHFSLAITWVLLEATHFWRTRWWFINLGLPIPRSRLLLVYILIAWNHLLSKQRLNNIGDTTSF